MTQDLTLAFNFAKELAVQLITLSTAVIGFTVTFSKELDVPITSWRLGLIACWVLFLLSIVGGVWTLMALTGSLAPIDNPGSPTELGSNVRIAAATQIVLFGLGLIVLIILGGTSFWKRNGR
jgi:hypothetical protein